MRKLKRRVFAMFMSVMMILQVFSVSAASMEESIPFDEEIIPEEVLNADGGYKEIPVYFEGKQVHIFEKYLRKYNDTALNENERFDISGVATFRIKAYAYSVGGEVKAGTYIEYLNDYGRWEKMNWRDREEQISGKPAEDFMNGKTDLSLTIEDITFILPDSNPDDRRVVFHMKSSLGNEFDRPTEKNVEFNQIDKEDEEKPTPTPIPTSTPTQTPMPTPEPGDLKITRKVTEVVDEKNVWEVEVKVEGEKKSEKLPTDVVLVLDRSGSMSNKINDVPRGDYVKKAAEKLVDDLLKEDNIRIGIVSFGGSKDYQFNGKVPAQGVKYYDNDWNPSYLKTENKEYEEWAECSVHNDFTRDPAMLQHSLDGALHEVARYGGTPISLGMVEAGLMLERNTGVNKVMIVITDGQATFMRDGTGPGDADVIDHNGNWPEKTAEDTILVANQAKARMETLKVFTVAAGADIKETDKQMLKACATQSQEYYYEANDSQDSLDGVMDKIAETVKINVASNTVLEEKLTSNLKIQAPDADINSKIKIVAIEDPVAGTTEPVDWKETSIAITQGSIGNVDNTGMKWNIGDLDNQTPAILKYRIYMESGVIGKKYDVTKNSKLKYIDKDKKYVTKLVPNSKVSLSWAKLNMSTYDNRTKTTVPGSELTIWQKVPKDYVAGNMTINYKLKYNSSDFEIDTKGDKTVGESVKLPMASTGKPTEIVGVLVDGDMYSVDKMNADGAQIVQSPTKIKSLVNEPEISSETNSTNNFVQPEGISNISSTLKITSKSKDISYTIDPRVLVNATLDGTRLMNYDFGKAVVQVTKLGSEDKLLVKDTDYTVDKLSANNIKINFSGVVEKGTQFKLDIYVPTKINQGINYGGTGSNTYLKIFNGTTIQIDTIITTTTKIEDITLEDGTIKEVYAKPVTISSVDKPDNKITLTFTEIAGIH